MNTNIQYTNNTIAHRQPLKKSWKPKKFGHVPVTINPPLVPKSQASHVTPRTPLLISPTHKLLVSHNSLLTSLTSLSLWFLCQWPPLKLLRLPQRHCWKMSLTLWSPQSGTSTSLRCGGHSFSLTISSLSKMVTLRRSSKSLKALIMNSTTATISTGFWVLKLLAFPSKTQLVVALATWCPRRSISTQLTMTAL